MVREQLGRAKARQRGGTPKGDRRPPRPLLAHPIAPNFASREGAGAASDSAGSSQGRTEHALRECVRGCGLCAPHSLSRQAAWHSAPAHRGPPGVPTGWGAPLDFPSSPDERASPLHPSSPGAQGQPPFFFLPTGPWLSPFCAPRSGGSRSGGPQSGPRPQRDPTKTHLRSERPSAIPRRSPPARATKTSSGQSFEKPPSPLPTDPGSLQPPLPRGCPGQVGASRRVHGCTPKSRRAVIAGAPTHAAEGWQAEAPGCAALGAGSPRPQRSALRASS